jgi:hypothetical protein
MKQMTNEHLSEDESDQLWAEEAVRRDKELDDGTAMMRDAENVFRDARALISSLSTRNLLG